MPTDDEDPQDPQRHTLTLAEGHEAAITVELQETGAVVSYSCACGSSDWEVFCDTKGSLGDAVVVCAEMHARHAKAYAPKA